MARYSVSAEKDVYYNRAKELGFRARSAFKLIQIDHQFGIFRGVRTAVDLCAAPGSWSQVLSVKLFEEQGAEAKRRPEAEGDDPSLAYEGVSEQLLATAADPELRRRKREAPRAVAVDLQEMAPIDGVHILRGDITSRATAEQIISFFGARVELVVCDGAPDGALAARAAASPSAFLTRARAAVTGFHEIDEYLQAQLLIAALNITTHILKPGGTFVAKFFLGESYALLESQLRVFFPEVWCVKPDSSRDRSAEAFVLCRGFAPPARYQPVLFSALDQMRGEADPSLLLRSEEHRVLVPFMACGDLSGFDAPS
jgi:tRNA (cytidine32/guanosine34-2'-O)-methyltransferase